MSWRARRSHRPSWSRNGALTALHDFNTLMVALDSPLIVVTTADERERAGCLVEFHVQSSIEPQRYCVWLSKANYTYRVALHSSYLVIHFLTADDLPLAELFGSQTGDTVDKFAGLEVDSGPGGAPVLRQCPHWLTVRRVALLDEGGDHVCLTTEPVAAHTAGPFRPLRVSQASHLKAGHGPRERPEPPTERAAPAGLESGASRVVIPPLVGLWHERIPGHRKAVRHRPQGSIRRDS